MPNPFNITFGEPPESLIERYEDINRIRSAFLDESPETKVFIITGPRGSGKTTLLTQARKTFKNKGFLTIDLNPYEEMLEQFASKLYEEGKMWKLFIQKEFSFSFQGISFSLKGKNELNNIHTLIEKMLEYVASKNKRVLITIDDVSTSANMKSFVFSYQQWIREKYPLFLLMDGLYENISEIENSKSLTFFLRAPKISLQPLNLASVSYSYQKLLNLNEADSIKYAKLTKGYAYGYQLLGSLLFKNGSPLNNLDEYDLKLNENSYSLIWKKLTQRERGILKEMTKSSKQIDLCNALNMNNGNFQTYKKRLIDKGIIVSTSRGMVSFSLPRFKEFIKLQTLLED